MRLLVIFQGGVPFLTNKVAEIICNGAISATISQPIYNIPQWSPEFTQSPTWTID